MLNKYVLSNIYNFVATHENMLNDYNRLWYLASVWFLLVMLVLL